MRRAFTMLRSGRPGPVVLAVPNASAHFDETADPYSPVKGWKSAPDPADVTTAVGLLMGAQAPLIYAGRGCYLCRGNRRTEGAGRTPQRTGHHNPQGQGRVSGRPPPVRWCKRRPSGPVPGKERRHPGSWFQSVARPVHPRDSQPGQQDDHPMQPGRVLPEPHLPDHHAVIGDARFTLQALADELSQRTGGAGRPADGVASEIKAARDESLAQYREVMASGDRPINPYRVFGDMMKALDPV